MNGELGIHKVIDSLFMDDLNREFEAISAVAMAIRKAQKIILRIDDLVEVRQHYFPPGETVGEVKQIIFHTVILNLF